MKLFESGRIGSLELKNRVVMAPMGIRGLTEPDGDWGDRVRAYYEARAAGGVGLITTEMVFVSQAHEPVAKLLLSMYSEKNFASLKLLAERIHAHDSKLSVQLTAGFGRVIPAPIIDEDVAPISASANTNFYVPEMEEYNSRAMTTEEAADLAQSFGFSALRCREAGADCVELHGHEGYLLDQFKTALWNRRDDRYGGSREKRLTFTREAIEAIQREAGQDFPIIYRFGITHYLEGGREEEEGLWLAKELEKMGVAALHIDAGCYETSWWPHPPSYQPPGCMVDMAEKAKQVTSLPIISVGRLQYPEVAESVVAEGKADFIAIGRGLLSDPEWVNKVQDGKTDAIIPCIGCHEGCLWQMIAGEPTSCSLNPITGHEIEWKVTKLKEKKSLLVIGGGPGGIEAARVGAERGFAVTLWEASDKIGGNLWPASTAPFKRDIADYLHYLQGLVKRIPVQIEFNKIATLENIKAFGADWVIVSTGAEMEQPPFESGPAEKILTSVDVLNGKELQGDRILIMGAGVIGCETAVYLADRGKKITLCAREDSDDLDMANYYDHNNRFMLLNMVNDHPDITVLRGTIPIKLENDHVLATREQDESKITLPMDSLVFSGRFFSKNSLTESLAELDNVTSIGDCVEPGRIMEAVWGAFNTVREIEG
ncbi:MAG: FAD-dependent oxidoreductase [Proteobacteria bacterium]|nr:FAD-dependent oxidoreductase [Pseudomonadota bacterium]